MADERARAGAFMAVGSMLCVQLGLAVSVSLFDRVGPEGAAWLRLAWAGVLMLLIVRPRRSAFTRRSFGYSMLLGVATALVTLLFMAALQRIPMGTASALEFLGPLGVAVATAGAGRRMVWPMLAAVGVLLLTQPWSGHVDLIGVLFALGAALSWASYILLTQRVGDAVAGVNGLAVSMTTAGLVATVVAGPIVFDRITPELILIGLGLAVLVPVVPFTLEFLALRRLSTSAFGTLMSLEPAFALGIGLLVLHQNPGIAALAGVAFVVTAGIGAARAGARPAPLTTETARPALS